MFHQDARDADTHLESLVSLLPRLIGFGRVNVSQSLLLGLGSLGLLQLGEDVGCAVLGQRLLEVLDGQLKVLLTSVGGSDASIRSATERSRGSAKPFE